MQRKINSNSCSVPTILDITTSFLNNYRRYRRKLVVVPRSSYVGIFNGHSSSAEANISTNDESNSLCLR